MDTSTFHFFGPSLQYFRMTSLSCYSYMLSFSYSPTLEFPPSSSYFSFLLTYSIPPSAIRLTKSNHCYTLQPYNLLYILFLPLSLSRCSIIFLNNLLSYPSISSCSPLFLFFFLSVLIGLFLLRNNRGYPVLTIFPHSKPI